MPYSERVAEAYIQAKDDPAKQEQLVREGQFGNSAGTSVAPKYRLPTKGELDRQMAGAKSITNVIAAGAGGLVGAASAPMGLLVGTGIKSLGDVLMPSIEDWAKGKESVPVYENWTENDFWNAYGGS